MINSNNVLSGRSTTLIRAIGVALKQQGKLYDRPQPHKEQKTDRLQEGIYTASGAGETVFPVVRAWREREHQKSLQRATISSFAMADDEIFTHDRKRMTLLFAATDLNCFSNPEACLVGAVCGGRDC
jgi:hypothetical protein